MMTRIPWLVKKATFFLMIIVSMMPISAFGQSTPTQVNLSLDKQSYSSGDIVVISGTVTSPGASNSMILQVYSPDNMLVQIGTVIISSDGKFSTSIQAEGPSWGNAGSYLVKMIYVSPPTNAVATANIAFRTSIASNTASQQGTQSSNQTQSDSLEEQIQKRIALANKLRDSLNGNTSSNSGQIPSWMKDDAKNWHDGVMDNVGFSKGIQYMISNGLVKIGWTVKSTDSFERIPLWVKHVAGWWSQDLVSNDEYIKSIQYLLQNKIINTMQ
ncbi:MAG: hypothetical protein D4R90_00435 [Nitrosopumilales archaeon]|nr:MAG: hypothetical protein D4R90_00435 [Nitrosopumilales archaeon]